MVRRESEKMLETERVHAIKQSKARAQAKQADLRKDWADKSGQRLQELLTAQGELQAEMLRLQKASLRAEMAQDSTYTSASSVYDAAGRVGGGGDSEEEHFEAAKRRLAEMEADVLAQQRQRFDEMREYMNQEHQALLARQTAAATATGRYWSYTTTAGNAVTVMLPPLPSYLSW